MKNLIAIFFLILVISACQNGKEKADPELSFTYDSIKVESKNKLNRKGNPIAVGNATITYPVFKLDTINWFIKQQVINFLSPEESETSYQYIADSFVKGYEDYAVESKEVVTMPWTLMITIKVLNQKPNYLSLKYTHYDYVGGAHGNTVSSFLNYNPTTNNPITLDSLIEKNKMGSLVKLAEGIFRKNEKLSPTESLEDKYFFDKGKFALAQSFHVTTNGLVFLYNPYEIKPYASGYTELIIPFSALKGIAKPNTILTTPQ